MVILVTGAAGFIGSHTVDYLLGEGHTVVGVDNFRTGHRENLAGALEDPNFTLREADLGEGAESISKLVSEVKPDAILHLAALVSVVESVEDPEANFRANIRMVQDLLEAARRQSVRRFVFASSAAVYGNTESVPIREEACVPAPLSPYGAAKLSGEALLQAYHACYGLETVAFRYFNIFGPRQDPSSPYSGVISIFMDRLDRNAGLTVFGDGTQTRDFVYVRDVARLNAAALTRDAVASGVCNLCTGEESSLNALIEIISEAKGVDPTVEYRDARTGDIYRSVGSPERLAHTFALNVDYNLRSGILEWIGKEAK